MDRISEEALGEVFTALIDGIQDGMLKAVILAFVLTVIFHFIRYLFRSDL